MPSAVPAGVYGLRVPTGGIAVPAAVDPTAAFRVTMAAIDPSAEPNIEEEGRPLRATLKIIRMPMDFEGDDDEDDEDYDEDDVDEIRARLRAEGVLGESDDSDMSEDEDEEKNGGPSDPAKSKKAKQEAMSKKIQKEIEADEMELDGMPNGVNGKSKGKAKAIDDNDSDESEDDEGDEAEELVLCTLDPEKNYQQPLDITVREGEEVYFSVSGTHEIYLTGNYVAFPEGNDSDDEEGMDQLGYDLSPDEDELDEDMDDASESEGDELDDIPNPRVTEVESEEEAAPKLIAAGKKGKNKRAAESDEDEAATLDDLISKSKQDAPAANGEKLSKKQAKKLKKNDGQAGAAAQEASAKDEKTDTPNSDKKKVQFAKNLEQGPSGSPKVEEAKKEAAKGPRNVNGVTIDDKKEGKGRAAKKGDRIEMRYIGKLKSGKVFDSNKKGKPFSFKLGTGEVIKGWDVGVAGMMPGGERRLTIPAKLAYGSKALPDIPANSDLIFDIKCMSVS